jgi:hypothetical protein
VGDGALGNTIVWQTIFLNQYGFTFKNQGIGQGRGAAKTAGQQKALNHTKSDTHGLAIASITISCCLKQLSYHAF